MGIVRDLCKRSIEVVHTSEAAFTNRNCPLIAQAGKPEGVSVRVSEFNCPIFQDGNARVFEVLGRGSSIDLPIMIAKNGIGAKRGLKIRKRLAPISHRNNGGPEPPQTSDIVS